MGTRPSYPYGSALNSPDADTRDEARKMALEHFVRKLETDLEVLEVKARTERCDICQYTYTPSEVIERDGERLCVYCYDDKFGYQALSPDDIPF
jgi:formylmethanofuran dehydrogenase subunit E